MKYPEIDLAGAARVFKRLRDSFDLLSLYGSQLSGPPFDIFVSQLADLVGSREEPVDIGVMRSIVSHLAGQTLTHEKLTFLFKFLGANYLALRRGSTMMPAGIGCHPGWGYVQIIDLEAIKHGDRKRIALQASVVWGTWYGHKLERVVDPFSPLLSLMMRRLGVTSRRHKYGTPRDLVQLYALVKMEATSFGRLPLTFGSVECPPYTRRLNDMLTRERRKPCVRGYLHPCNSCPVGYGDCNRATRAVPLTVHGALDAADESHPTGSSSENDKRDVLDEPTEGHPAQLCAERAPGA